MRLGILIFIALIPALTMAQQKDLGFANNVAGAIPSAQPATLLPENDDSSSLAPENTPEIDSTATQATNPSPAGNASKSQSTKTNEGFERRPTSGSMVGYVDSAIVGTQVRIRFDDAFHNSTPDRAEFFYAQCGCTNAPTASGPNFPGASSNINFQQVYLMAEYAPLTRFSIFTEVPFRWIEPQPGSFIPGSYDPNAVPPEVPSTETNSGISDVRAGLKLALAASSTHSVTLQVKAYFPSGNISRGLGTGHYSIEPSLLYYQQLSPRWAVESQIGDTHPIGGSTGVLVNTTTTANFAGDVLFYGIGPSYQLINREGFRVAPVVELFGWHVLSGLETLPGSFIQPSGIAPNYICNNDASPSATLGCSYSAGGTNIVNLKVGARTSFGNRNSIYVGFGQAITHAVWYEHIVRAEYRYSF